MILEHYLRTADYDSMTLHAVLLADRHRVESYRRAIRTLVQPGMRVLDLGAGTGVLGRFAAEMGAGVTMVESEQRPTAVATLLNRLLLDGDPRIISSSIEEAEVPAQDVIVHELMGGRLLDEGMAGKLRAFAARNEWYPRALHIPASASIWVQLVWIAEDTLKRSPPSWDRIGGDARDVSRWGEVVWATSPDDVLRVSDWVEVMRFASEMPLAWQSDRLVSGVETWGPSNALLWGFTANLAEGCVLDGRLGMGPRTSWGGTLELIGEGELPAATYEIGLDWSDAMIGSDRSLQPWLRKVGEEHG